MPVEKGIALLTGIEVIEVPLPSGDLEVDYSIWAKVALQKIVEFDGLYIHIKGPDEPAHDGDFIKKTRYKINLQSVRSYILIIAFGSSHEAGLLE